MLKCFLHHICKIYHQTRCCIFSLNSLKGEIIVICIVLARKSTDFFWQGIANSGNQDTGFRICNKSRKLHENFPPAICRYLLSIHWRLYNMNTSSVHLHVKPDFSGNQDSGNTIKLIVKKKSFYSKTQDTGRFATNHGKSMRILFQLFVDIWCPSISNLQFTRSVNLHVNPDFIVHISK